MKKSKRFDRLYNTNNYQIVCQLLVKENDQWFLTGLSCETHVVTSN